MHVSLRLSAIAAATAALLMGTAASTFAATPPPHVGSTISQPTVFTGGVRSRVLSTSVGTTDTRNLQMTGWIDLYNPGTTALTVKISFTVVQKGGATDTHPENERVNVGPHAHVTVPAGLVCNGMPAGTYDIQVFIKPTKNVTVESASETVLGIDPQTPNSYKTRTASVAIGSQPTPVLSTTIAFPTSAAPAVQPLQTILAQGWVNVVNGSTKTTVTLDYFMDGINVGSLSQIVGPDQPVSIPFSFTCDGAYSGDHTFSIQLSAGFAGPITRSGFLSVMQFPLDGTMGNASVNGDGSPVPLGTKTQQLLPTEISLANNQDVWMGGWLTFKNTTAKTRTVQVQSATGGTAVGPALTVTLAKHGRLSVPFGLIGTGGAGGITQFDVLVHASASGVSYTGEGHLTTWSVAP